MIHRNLKIYYRELKVSRKTKRQCKNIKYISSPVEMKYITTKEPIPDTPVSFGYKCQWLAVKTDNQEEVVKVLGLVNPRKSNWEDGIKMAYSGKIFVTPQIDSWILVVSSDMLSSNQSEDDINLGIINKLSKEFGNLNISELIE